MFTPVEIGCLNTSINYVLCGDVFFNCVIMVDEGVAPVFETGILDDGKSLSRLFLLGVRLGGSGY